MGCFLPHSNNDLLVPWPIKIRVHVLGLFEQGLLDREAIQFLFELGFVPSSTVDSRGLLTPTATTNSASNFSPIKSKSNRRSSDKFVGYDDQKIEASTSTTEKTIEVAKPTELAVTSRTNVLHNVNNAIPGVTTLHSNQTLRSLEATAIRKRLSQHDNLHHEAMKKKNQRKNMKNGKTDVGDQSPPVDNNNENQSRSWDVSHFPLSMSRYQREFKEIALLSSGSFGSVFRAVRELDGCEYAVKRITFDAMGYSKESTEQVIREVQCLAAVNDHPNIVRYYTSWWETTWMTGGMSNKGQKKLGTKLLQIEAGSNNFESIDHATEEWSSATSSSSSSSWSDDDYYSLDGGIESIGQDSWKSYHSRKVEPWTDSHDDSYMTKSASRRRRRSNKAKRKPSATAQYQYQISLYIQMQLCHPANLKDWIRERNKQIPESDHDIRIGPAVEIFQQICSGLAHIHESNVVHRDLKPANIFVSSDGKVIKIGDFGLSKQLRDIINRQQKNTFNDNRSSTQQTEQVSSAVIPVHAGTYSTQTLVGYNKTGENLTSGIGTASYAAPEQVQTKSYGTAVDIFSLGLIFLELVSCFETEHERLHNLQQCRYQRLPKFLDDNYPDIASTILACTRPKASDRPTARELIELAKIKSPRNQKEVQVLKRQLIEKNKEISMKNETIEKMRLEIERMRKLLASQTGTISQKNGDSSTSLSNQVEDYLVTDVVTFDDDN